MAYEYSPVKIIHFDFNSPEFITFWTKEDRTIELNAVSRHWVEKLITPQGKYKVSVEHKYRFYNEAKNQIGSYISEVYFFVPYTTDGKTLIDLMYIFADARDYTKNTFEQTMLQSNLAIPDLGELPVNEDWAEEALAAIKKLSQM